MLHKAEEKVKNLYPRLSTRMQEWDKWKEQWVRKHADNMTICSCHMCGNPRKLFKDETIQEKRFSQREKFCEES